MSKIVRNEFKKFFRGKIFIFEILLIVGLCVMSISAYGDMSDIAIEHLPKEETFSANLKMVLTNLNAVSFTKLFLTDYIYKAYFSFFSIFLVLIAVSTFSEDRESGNMKFTILTGMKSNTVVIGKLIFMAFEILLTIVFNLVLSFIVGAVSFGSMIDVKELLEVVGISFLSFFPAFTIAAFVAFISQIRANSKVIMTVGITAVFMMSILDATTKTFKFSPIGAFSLFPDVPVLSSDLFICCSVSVVYTLVLIVMLMIVLSKDEYYE